MRTDGPAIQEFLGQHRLALIGASHDEHDFSRAVLRALRAHDYDVVPINPRGGEIDGLKVFPRVIDVDGPVDGAIVMTPPAASADVVRDCVVSGVRRVWLHRGAGQGAVTDDAVREANEAGLVLVTGECPLMYLDDAEWFHRAHATLRRATGTWPMPAPPLPAGAAFILGALQLSIAIPAIASGLMLVTDPTGASLGLPIGLLARSPFPDFLVPGLVLLAGNGLATLAGASLSWWRLRSAGPVAIGLGAFLVAWIVAQVMFIGATSLLQPVLLAAGALEVALGVRLSSRG